MKAGTPAAKKFWQESWERNYELYEKSLLEAVTAEREQNGRCPKCNAHVPVRYPDTRARTDAVKTLHELAGLKPRPEDEGAGQAPIVTRRLVLPDAQVDGGEAGSKTPSMSPPSL
jgi:hypothetical protein